MIQFVYTIFYVEDVNKTILFYEKALDFTRKFIADTNDYGELAGGNTTLSFAAIELASKNLSKGFIESDLNHKPFGMEIGFTTNDVEKTFIQAIEAGAIEVEKVKTKPWGQTIAYVKDLNGFLIEICTPMS